MTRLYCLNGSCRTSRQTHIRFFFFLNHTLFGLHFFFCQVVFDSFTCYCVTIDLVLSRWCTCRGLLLEPYKRWPLTGWPSLNNTPQFFHFQFQSSTVPDFQYPFFFLHFRVSTRGSHTWWHESVSAWVKGVGGNLRLRWKLRSWKVNLKLNFFPSSLSTINCQLPPQCLTVLTLPASHLMVPLKALITLRPHRLNCRLTLTVSLLSPAAPLANRWLAAQPTHGLRCSVSLTLSPAHRPPLSLSFQLSDRCHYSASPPLFDALLWVLPLLFIRHVKLNGSIGTTR